MLHDKIVTENLKKINDGNKRIFFTNFHLKDGLGVEFTDTKAQL